MAKTGPLAKTGSDYISLCLGDQQRDPSIAPQYQAQRASRQRMQQAEFTNFTSPVESSVQPIWAPMIESTNEAQMFVLCEYELCDAQ